ncbi:DUF2268 domain-containing putative Zn-dependent protease [Lysobacter sp. Root983]|uniref:gliding motility protein GldB-related protein n=1 Tax=Lysobacter sp. Root983 TaxID=1736613 RepID=UPI0007104301|nr:DUF2268 domain-containing putative Zn-dependent protease [Lysobacter sp. Root983]KRD79790.1 hypothetical protein ASE43_02505 [Lysobacter sp. Root983]
MRATRLLLTTVSLLLLTAAVPAQRGPEIRVDDIERFYAIYDRAGGKPSAEELQRDYLDQGSPGLLEFARMRRITGERIAGMIAERPALYTNAKRCVDVLPAVETRLGTALGKLSQYYPPTRFPPVTLAIGRGKPVGTANASGVMIGLESLCAVDVLNPNLEDRFVYVIAHEYAHVLQPAAQVEDSNSTVLKASLIEGGAEFVGELISGSVGYSHLRAATRGKELALETAFLADQDQKAEGSAWLYNGLGTPERPGDLGYWVGYRIAKAYYRQAKDKRAAVREIIEFEDAKAFLAKSGWKPGMQLD